MKHLIRVNSTTKPSVFVDLGDGNWYYNYDIQSYEADITELNGTETILETRWSWIPIKLGKSPEYKECVELIIRQYITQSQEFDLINSYNKASLNMLSEEETEKACADYLEYLHKLEEIKTNVKKDF